jgi:hypothetical protein
MAHHGRKSKWFAAAQTAGYLDMALDCAADHEAAPATLIRAAREFAQKDPTFAACLALHAIAHPLANRGFEASPLDIADAVAHLMAATRQIDRVSWALDQLREIADGGGEDLMVQRLRMAIPRLDGEIGAGAKSKARSAHCGHSSRPWMLRCTFPELAIQSLLSNME